MNLTELARKLKVPTKELKAKLPELGFDIGLRAIQIPDAQAERVVEKWNELKKLEELRQRVQKTAVTEERVEKINEKFITLPSVITVHDLAAKLNLPIVKVISELLKHGVMATINDNLDYEIAAIIAESLGFQAEKTEATEDKDAQFKEKLQAILAAEKEKGKMTVRPPVVVVMGHVDHGKTSLLDYIRQTNVAAKESGAITQHIGAYQAEVKSKSYGQRLITFIDTPGHEAFNAIRSRGGQVADMAVLVIAADDKIQPQTLESLKIIQEMNLPFVVALNKIDRPEADLDKIKKGLSELNLNPEDWGGKVICVPVSAKTGEGIEKLLEMILLVADLEKEKLLTNPDRPAVGVVIESHLDSREGAVATILIYAGSLALRDNIIIGSAYGRVKAMKDFRGRSVDKVLPGMPAQILGLKGAPKVGDILEVVSDVKELKKRAKSADFSYKKFGFEGRAVTKEKFKEQKSLNVVLRTDVLGSLQAVSAALGKLDNNLVRLKIIKKDLGNITDADVDLAKSSGAWLVGFNVEVAPAAKSLAEEAGLSIHLYQVIYKLIDEIKEQMNTLLEPEIIEHPLGKIEVMAVFKKLAGQMIVGGRVTEGEITKGTKIRVWRKDQLMGEGNLAQLQINKQEVELARSGSECGLRFEGRTIIEMGDILEVYQEEKRERKVF